MKVLAVIALQDELVKVFRGRMVGLVDFMKEYWVFEREYSEKKLS